MCYLGGCFCSNGFLTYTASQDSTQPLIYCNYQQKSHVKALLLEFFLAFVEGHIYAGKYLIAFIKIFVMVGLIVSVCVVAFNSDGFFISESGWKYHTLITFKYMFYCVQAADIVCYGFNFYKDGNGQPLI
jgi:hypothetical protein